MFLRHLPVYLTMRRRDAERARAEIFFHGRIGDDFQMDLFAGENSIEFLANIFLVSRIVRMNGDSRVAKLCLGSSRRY